MYSPLNKVMTDRLLWAAIISVKALIKLLIGSNHKYGHKIIINIKVKPKMKKIYFIFFDIFLLTSNRYMLYIIIKIKKGMIPRILAFIKCSSKWIKNYISILFSKITFWIA